ncbi:MAG: outer membrane PBP1 activator LpoA protein [Paraglaciecola sp.]|jgi:outer membrane PBP1 activator LpoA protein
MNFSRLVLVSTVIILLVSCSSAPQRGAQRTAETPVSQIPEVTFSSDYYLDKAVEDYSRSGDVEQRNQWLLQAAEAFQLEQRCDKSIKLLRVIQAELQIGSQQAQGQLIMAECYLQFTPPAVQQAQQLIAKIPPDLGFEQRVNKLEVKIFLSNKQWINAAKGVLNSAIEDSEKSQKIWGLLQNLSLKDLKQASLDESQLQPWVQLSLITRQFGLQPVRLRTAVVEWQASHITHPLSESLPPELTAALATDAFRAAKVAVLLPLTGRLANQGQAIKQGILAAYLENLDEATLPEPSPRDIVQGVVDNLPLDNIRQIHFFDSAFSNPQELAELVADYDFVIGPLLKDKISGLLRELPINKPILALNRIEKSPLAFPTEQREAFYFALAPEDEAQQMAKHLSEIGLKHPIIFAANTNSTKRMTEAFAEQWKTSANNTNYIPPDIATFNTNKEMGEQVTALLDVAHSKERIKQIEYLASSEVFGVERNRRDIDAIVLFANPEQTALLNPIIETSLSPFARQTLSVFASSRSYSLQLNKNSFRDLRNLTFSDMPWMLPDHQWADLEQQTKLLWPQREDTLMRLFALGFDVYKLIPKLRHMKLLPHNIVDGMTGEISMDETGNLLRRLSWAKISHDRVTALAMD